MFIRKATGTEASGPTFYWLDSPFKVAYCFNKILKLATNWRQISAAS